MIILIIIFHNSILNYSYDISTSAVMNRHQEQLEKPYRPYLPSDSAMRRRLQRSRRKEQPALLNPWLRLIFKVNF